MNSNVRISDDFWNRYRKLVKKEMIPYQLAVLNDAIDITIEKERDDAFIPNEKSHAMEVRQKASITAGSFRTAMYINGWRRQHILSDMHGMKN